jgi:hypothetical protein
LENLLEHILDFLAMGGGVDSILQHFFVIVTITSAAGRTAVYAAAGRASVHWTDVFDVFVRTLFLITVICLILYFVCAGLVIKANSGLVW